jgi:hypothetical protein
MSDSGTSLICSKNVARAAATSGRDCSLACSDFFERQLHGRQRLPQRADADNDLQLGRHTRPQLLQRRVRLLVHEAGQFAAGVLVQLGLGAAHRPWGDRLAFVAPLLDPPRPRPADLQSFGDLLGLQSFVVQRQHPLAQVH